MNLNAQLAQLIGVICAGGSLSLVVLIFAVVVVSRWLQNFDVTD